MGIFDELTTADKKRVTEVMLSQARVELYGVLVQLGIDPEGFDPEGWDKDAILDGTLEGRVGHYLRSIASLEEKRDFLNGI